MSEDPLSDQAFTLEGVVETAATAAAIGRGPDERYPPVLSTPALIAELERAAAALMRPLLKQGEVSVGASVEVRHLAPTALGARYTATARYTGRKSKLYLFEVWAEDRSGRIMEGTHARAIVPLAAIEEAAAAR